MVKSEVDLNRIQLFLEIVKVGSITKTAELLNLQKSKVSRDLALLEQELGTQLIYRTTRQFNLTSDGQRFYEKANTCIQTLNEAITETSAEAKTIAGHVSITSPEDVGEIVLIPLLEEFSLHYPKVTYNIDFSTEVKDLVANKVDLAIRPGKLKDSSLIMKKVGQIEFGLYCSHSFHEKLPTPLTPETLSQLPTIYFSQSTRSPSWELGYRGKKMRINLDPLAKVTSYTAVFKFIERGMGIGVLPTFIVNQQNSSVIQILKGFKMDSFDIQIVYPQRNEDLARVRVLSDFLLKRMKVVF